MEKKYICSYCEKECKNVNSLRNHERMCKRNPDHIESPFVKFNKNHTLGKTSVWNKGLTKETDLRIKRHGEVLKKGYKTGRLIPSNLGTHHTEEEKAHLSEMRKKYLREHPDKVPYLLNHHSKQSYPERYFEYIFSSDEILKQFQKEYKVESYSLDFAIPEIHFYLEIDGDQHYLDKKIIEHDKIRTERLDNLGWICKRIRWSTYKSLDFNNRRNTILELKEYILNLQNKTL